MLRHMLPVCLLTAGLVQAADEIPEMDEYAWQFPIKLQENAEYFEARIPLSVYRSVTDSQLRDLGVYDATGRAIPRIAQDREDAGEDTEIRLPLGIIPLYGEPGQNADRLRLLMESSDAGTRFEFKSNADDARRSSAELHSYIVDLRNLEDQTFTEIEFDWPDSAGGFIGVVQVDQSNDLSRWRLATRGTLADLEFEQTRIRRNRVEIPPNVGNFLRITWHEMPENWQISSVTGVRKEAGPDLFRDWATTTPLQSSEDEREFVFEIGGYPPIDRAELELDGQNVVVRAALEYRSGPEDSWRRVHQGLFYTVGADGNRIISQPVRISKTRARQWRVRILSGRVDGSLQLRLGWLPGRILFLSQGEPPYTLGTGRAQDAVDNFPQHRLLGDSSLFAMLLDTKSPGLASIGLRAEAAGMAALEDARTWTWRTVALWIGLLGAVAFVGWLVWSLMRENKNKSGEN